MSGLPPSYTEPLPSYDSYLNTVEFNEFDRNLLKTPKKVLCIGQRGSGKTNLICDLRRPYLEETYKGMSWDAKSIESLVSYAKAKDTKYTVMDNVDVIDDCEKLKSSIDKNCIRKSLYRFLFIGTQPVVGLDPTIKCYIDYIFILRLNTSRNKQKVYEQYIKENMPSITLKNFICLVDRYTCNNGCLVIDNKSSETKPTDRLFYYQPCHLL